MKYCNDGSFILGLFYDGVLTAGVGRRWVRRGEDHVWFVDRDLKGEGSELLERRSTVSACRGSGQPQTLVRACGGAYTIHSQIGL